MLKLLTLFTFFFLKTKLVDGYNNKAGEEETPYLSSPSSLTSSLPDHSGPDVAGADSAFALDTDESSDNNNSDHSSTEEKARAAFSNPLFARHYPGPRPLSDRVYTEFGGRGGGEGGGGSDGNIPSSGGFLGSPDRMWSEDIATALAKATACAIPPLSHYYDNDDDDDGDGDGDGRFNVRRWSGHEDDNDRVEIGALKTRSSKSAALPRIVFGSGAFSTAEPPSDAASLHAGVTLRPSDLQQQQTDPAFSDGGVSPDCSTAATTTTIAVPNAAFSGGDNGGGVSPAHTPRSTKYDGLKSPSPPSRPPLLPVRSRGGSPRSPKLKVALKHGALSNNAGGGGGGVFVSSPGDVPMLYSPEPTRRREGRFSSWDGSGAGEGRHGRVSGWDGSGRQGRDGRVSSWDNWAIAARGELRSPSPRDRWSFSTARRRRNSLPQSLIQHHRNLTSATTNSTGNYSSNDTIGSSNFDDEDSPPLTRVSRISSSARSNSLRKSFSARSLASNRPSGGGRGTRREPSSGHRERFSEEQKHREWFAEEQNPREPFREHRGPFPEEKRRRKRRFSRDDGVIATSPGGSSSRATESAPDTPIAPTTPNDAPPVAWLRDAESGSSRRMHGGGRHRRASSTTSSSVAAGGALFGSPFGSGGGITSDMRCSGGAVSIRCFYVQGLA